MRRFNMTTLSKCQCNQIQQQQTTKLVRVRRVLLREETKRPMGMLKKLRESVVWKTNRYALYKSGLYTRMARRNQLMKDIYTSKICPCRMGQKTIGRRCSDPIKSQIQLDCLIKKAKKT